MWRTTQVAVTLRWKHSDQRNHTEVSYLHASACVEADVAQTHGEGVVALSRGGQFLYTLYTLDSFYVQSVLNVKGTSGFTYQYSYVSFKI